MVVRADLKTDMTLAQQKHEVGLLVLRVRLLFEFFYSFVR